MIKCTLAVNLNIDFMKQTPQNTEDVWPLIFHDFRSFVFIKTVFRSITHITLTYRDMCSVQLSGKRLLKVGSILLSIQRCLLSSYNMIMTEGNNCFSYSSRTNITQVLNEKNNREYNQVHKHTNKSIQHGFSKQSIEIHNLAICLCWKVFPEVIHRPLLFIFITAVLIVAAWRRERST